MKEKGKLSEVAHFESKAFPPVTVIHNAKPASPISIDIRSFSKNDISSIGSAICSFDVDSEHSWYLLNNRSLV